MPHFYHLLELLFKVETKCKTVVIIQGKKCSFISKKALIFFQTNLSFAGMGNFKTVTLEARRVLKAGKAKSNRRY